MNDEPLDQKLDALVARARTNYRVPPASPPLDEMWNAIAHELYEVPQPRRARDFRPWWGAAMGIAAALVIGFALGRTTMPGRSVDAAALADASTVGDSSIPYERTATTLLGETAV